MIIKRILIAAVMLLALAGVIWFGMSGDKPAASSRHHGGHGGGHAGAAGGGVPVLTAAATTQNVPVILEGVGTVQAFQTVTVQPQVTGKLLSLNFREGQQVKKGDVLAKIDPVTYQATLDEARAKLAMDQASLANAQLDLGRYERLVKTNYVSKQQADQARATVRQDQAQIESDKATVDSARATLGYTSIVAPISGRTGIRMVDEGNIVNPSDTNGIVVITQLQPITVIFTLPAADIGTIRAAADQGTDQGADERGLPVRVLRADSSKVLDTGSLEVINNQVDETTGTVKLKAVLPNKAQALWPGEFVNARLQVGTLDNATVVPVAAVQQGPDGAFVYLLAAGGKAQMRSVTVTQQSETEAVIGQGVVPGQQVITAGFGQLSDGAKVKLGSDKKSPGQGGHGGQGGQGTAGSAGQGGATAQTRASTAARANASQPAAKAAVADTHSARAFGKLSDGSRVNADGSSDDAGPSSRTQGQRAGS